MMVATYRVLPCSTVSSQGQAEPGWLRHSPVGQGGPLPGSGQLRPRQAPVGVALGRSRRTQGLGREGRFLLPVRLAASALGW